METSLENWYVDIGTEMDKTFLHEFLHGTIFISLLSLGSSHS